jgi:hypothetical protein
VGVVSKNWGVKAEKLRLLLRPLQLSVTVLPTFFLYKNTIQMNQGHYWTFSQSRLTPLWRNAAFPCAFDLLMQVWQVMTCADY